MNLQYIAAKWVQLQIDSWKYWLTCNKIAMKCLNVSTEQLGFPLTQRSGDNYGTIVPTLSHSTANSRVRTTKYLKLCHSFLRTYFRFGSNANMLVPSDFWNYTKVSHSHTIIIPNQWYHFQAEHSKLFNFRELYALPNAFQFV